MGSLLCNSIREEVETLPHFSPHKLCTAASLGLAQHTFECEGALAEGSIYNRSLQGWKRTRMISVTDEIAPATHSVIAGGSKGVEKEEERADGRLSNSWYSEKCGSKINTVQGSEIP